LLPRKAHNDQFSGDNDAVYPALETSEINLASNFREPDRVLKVDADEERLPRAPEDMEQEARWLRTFFESDEISGLL